MIAGTPCCVRPILLDRQGTIDGIGDMEPQVVP
jgi:hypothetical protein